MGNLIQRNNEFNYNGQIIKISSESITPREAEQTNKMEIKYINTIHHKKTIKEIEDTPFYNINKATNFNSVKKYIHQKPINNLNETVKNNTNNNIIANTNASSNSKNILSKVRPYHPQISRNDKNENENNLRYLVNSNLYEFEIDSSSKSIEDKNIVKAPSKKENLNKKSPVKAVQIPKKKFSNRNIKNSNMGTINKQFISTEKTIINESDYSMNDTKVDNNKSISNNEKNIKTEKNSEIKDKKTEILNSFIIKKNFVEKNTKLISGIKINANSDYEFKIPKRIGYFAHTNSNNNDTIKPINSFIYCPTAKNIFKPKKLFKTNISLYTNNKIIKPKKLLKNEIKSENSISKNKTTKTLSETKKINSTSGKKIFKKHIHNFSVKKLFHKKNSLKKYDKEEINIDITSELNKDSNQNTVNDTSYNTNANSIFYLNESQKNQKLKQLIEKISDNKLKKEILNVYKNANPYSNKESLYIKYNKLQNKLNNSYNSRSYNRTLWSNSMRISNQSNINYYPDLSQSQNIGHHVKKGISLRKRISSKNTDLSSCISSLTPIKKININLLDMRRRSNNENNNYNLTVKNTLLSNLINEKIYYQSDIKKLIDINYFLINVKKSEYETEIKTHDILCLISDKYFTTLDKSENCNIPKKVIKVKTIKKVNIISIGIKQNINIKYVVIIVGYCYSNEIKGIKEVQEGLLIDKKKDVDDMVEVLSKLISDLEILYL